MKNTQSADFCADRIDVITNFAVTTNVVIKRGHCPSSLGIYEQLPDRRSFRKYLTQTVNANVVYLCADKRKNGQTDRKVKFVYPSIYFVRLGRKTRISRYMQSQFSVRKHIFISVEKRANMSTGLDFLCTWT